jgi:hypothetical protein
MIGDLFIVRKVSPNSIKKMTVNEIIYWHKWHSLSENAEIDEIERIKNLK